MRSWVSHLLLWLALTLTGAVQIYPCLYYSFMANRVPVSIQIHFDRKWQNLVWVAAFSGYHFSTIILFSDLPPHALWGPWILLAFWITCPAMQLSKYLAMNFTVKAGTVKKDFSPFLKISWVMVGYSILVCWTSSLVILPVWLLQQVQKDSEEHNVEVETFIRFPDFHKILQNAKESLKLSMRWWAEEAHNLPDKDLF